MLPQKFKITKVIKTKINWAYIEDDKTTKACNKIVQYLTKINIKQIYNYNEL